MSTTITHPPEVRSGTTTSWLPITTAFPYQLGCSEAVWANYGITSSLGYYGYVFDPLYNQLVNPSYTCLPPAATKWWQQPDLSESAVTRWSIGPLVCPQAYTTASTSSVDVTSTQIVCCPSAYRYVFDPNMADIGICITDVTSGQTVTYAMEKTLGNTLGGVNTTSIIFLADDAMKGLPVIGYVFAEAVTTSSSSSSSSSTSSQSSTSPSQTASSTNSGTPSPTSTPHTSSSGLSTGAKAGIGIGVAVVALAVIALAVIMLLRHRRSRYATTEEYKAPEGVQGGYPEIDGQPRSELPVHHEERLRAAEMQG